MKMLFKIHVGRTSCREHETTYCRPTTLSISLVSNECCKQINQSINLFSNIKAPQYDDACCFKKPSRKRSQNPHRSRRANKFMSQTGQRKVGNTSLRQPQENVFRFVNQVSIENI